MSKQMLQMKYHPAKKEVEFKRFQGGKEVPIRSDSRLMKYMNMKGKFVLQDHGNEFFKDIAYCFDGETEVNIKVITTKTDFEDFEQMVEFFNEEKEKCKITATLLSELPDMNNTYETIKNFGEDAVNILNVSKGKLYEVDLTNSNVKANVEEFRKDFEKEQKSIEGKIKAMTQNSVNLCFTGVYSAGKSALINALLGYAILPEAVNSETARMVIIESPKNNTPISITFKIKNVFSELVWNSSNNIFEFVSGPIENNSRQKIQNVIEENKNEKQYLQINKILKHLNGNDDVSSDINVYFPVPIDTENVHFKIYDTPGTDSNVGEHKLVLQEALSEQTNSILIFVAAPTKLEGEGNNALLEYLKEAEKKDSKTSIDINRSLFVINWADSIKPTERENLRLNGEIKDKSDEDFSIKLSDKKLFFTSARYAYAAKAKMNDIQTEDTNYDYEQELPKTANEKYGRYYQQDHCANSELLTKKLIDNSNNALERAESNGKEEEKYYICSGVYALEEEIKNYGEKYSSAVKAYAIIDTVDKAMNRMNTTATSLSSKNQTEIETVAAAINKTKHEISSKIDEAYNKYAIKKDAGLPDDIAYILQLDSHSLSNFIIDEPIGRIDKLLKKWFFNMFGKVPVKSGHQEKINNIISGVLNNFASNFKTKRTMLLEKTRDDFIDNVKEIINNTGKLSKEAKDYICNIRVPEIEEFEINSEIDSIYNSHIYSGGFIFKKYIDKEAYLNELEKYLHGLEHEVAKSYAEDYRYSLESILSDIKSEYTNNIDKYSVLIKAKMEDKESMERLGEKIQDTANELKVLQDKLNEIIWEVKENG